jgi:probable phosphoglycerate mutase
MRILLARHGETKWNAEGRYQGQVDVPLSETGEAQARLLGDRLGEVRIDRAVVTRVLHGRRPGESTRRLGIEFRDLTEYDRYLLRRAIGHRPLAPPGARPGRRQRVDLKLLVA